MKKRHVNIPIFIPHKGCPNDCVFCNQHKITGAQSTDCARDIVPEIEECLKTVDKDTCECEIAFFGGSFTGIPRKDMIYLLETAYRYIKEGRVESIRLSTRPDFIDREILDILLKYGVKHIELGIQSLDDNVLVTCKRGHTAKDTRVACKLIKEYGFSLTGQMMIGLPGATLESEVATATGICNLGADSARIYPTVVFYDTELCNMAKRGEYTLLTNREAVERAAKVYRVFVQNNVKLLRIGLQSGEGLCDKNIYGGANHSAIGEMVIGAYYYDLIVENCRNYIEKQELRKKDRVVLTVFCAEGETSKVSGQKRVNKIKIADYFKEFGIEVCEIKILEKHSVEKNTIETEVKVIGKVR